MHTLQDPFQQACADYSHSVCCKVLATETKHSRASRAAHRMGMRRGGGGFCVCSTLLSASALLTRRRPDV